LPRWFIRRRRLAKWSAGATSISSRCVSLDLAFMALAPVFLLVRGAPSYWDTLAFAFLLAPLLGVYALQRYGRYDIAQAICVGAMILLGVTLTCANGGMTTSAFACFCSRRWRPRQAQYRPRHWRRGGVARRSGRHGGGDQIRPASSARRDQRQCRCRVVASAMLYGALLAVWERAHGRNARSARQQERGSYRELTETVGDMVMQLDHTGAVVDVVTDPVNAFHYGPGDLLGRGLFERILVSDRPKFLKRFGIQLWPTRRFAWNSGCARSRGRDGVRPRHPRFVGSRCGRIGRSPWKGSSWRSCATRRRSRKRTKRSRRARGQRTGQYVEGPLPRQCQP